MSNPLVYCLSNFSMRVFSILTLYLMANRAWLISSISGEVIGLLFSILAYLLEPSSNKTTDNFVILTILLYILLINVIIKFKNSDLTE
jgi:hypothetical protein